MILFCKFDKTNVMARFEVQLMIQLQRIASRNGTDNEKHEGIIRTTTMHDN